MKKKTIKIESKSEDLSFSFTNIFFNGIFLLFIILGMSLIFFMLFMLFLLFKNFLKEIIATGIIFIFVLLLGILRISFLKMKEAINE